MYNGVGIGLEHISGDEETDYNFVIELTFLCFKLFYLSDKE